MSKKDKIWGLLIVLLIIIFGVIFWNSIYKYKDLLKEFRSNKEEARLKYEKLKNRIEEEKQEKLKIKLEKKFKWLYFCFRFVLVFLWAIFLLVLKFTGCVTSLEDALNYSEAVILVLVGLNFLIFGSFKNIQGFIDLIKERLKNWIWGKHINI